VNSDWKIGLDVGSTTVKAVVMDVSGNIHWKQYRRHNTRQAVQVRDFLQEIQSQHSGQLQIFITGSGSRALAPHINARYIQEVNAVTYAVERLHPDTGSVLELGGQDAKVIIWNKDDQGRRSTQTYMNDKCAGGTGATIDKILSKIGISHEEAAKVMPAGRTVHPIAAKCGVFAETDIVGLLKSGINREEIVVSLLTAIARQNLEVLVRGNVLKDRVLLLGGPHTYLQGFADIWRKEIPAAWDIHGWTPRDLPLSELIHVPDDAQYFAAIGAVLFGLEARQTDEEKSQLYFAGLDKLEHFLDEGRYAQLMSSGAVREGLVESDAEVAAFAQQYSVPEFVPPVLEKGTRKRVTIGIDGGSTSSKLVLLDEQGELLYKDYLLSQGNPIEDVSSMFGRMEQWAVQLDLELEIAGTAITGYASAILREAFSLDLAVVETVAHMRGATRYYGDIDIICDVGGQDIKVLFMKHGRVVDFKLNTQCSAGNGYFLQGMAEQFGIPIEEYAAHAFRARKAPAFNYGCAVFMEQDRVNFQQLGWTTDEIMAGLALVLPLNIWNYVVQEPHIARYGRKVVLQGGTQKNLAAAKAQVDYIRGKVPDAEIHVHRYADLCGALGAAIECQERQGNKSSSFIGIGPAARITFTTRCDDTTRCTFCKNRCTRTFVDIKPLPDRNVQFISGYGCDKGMTTTVADMKAQEQERKAIRKRFPNLVDEAAREVFAEYTFEPIPEAGTPADSIMDLLIKGDGHRPVHKRRPRRIRRSPESALERRKAMVVGIPRLLNNYFYAPFFSTWLRTLGVEQVVYSDYTSEQLWAIGNKWGAIDPCFPAKVAPAHIYNLLKKGGISHICFPIITHLESHVTNTLGNNACVIQMGTPEVAHAVFTRSRDIFAEHSIEYWKPIVRMDNPPEAAGLLFDYFGTRLGITEEENAWAVRQGYRAMDLYFSHMRKRGTRVISDLVANDRIGVVMLGHPYHHDPGFNHGILDEFQARGFSVLCIESLPVDEAFLGPLFAGNTAAGVDIKDVWQRNFNRNTNLKVWAAGIVARHPNLAAIDLSSFKCGHDAPTYSYISSILDAAKTPHFLIHDIDQNKPRASIKIRLQTIDYFLRAEEKRLRDRISGGQNG
jgi:activator of 2-hydroxyglutaryl-CoA dehydratase/predicted nucleotide-binding protein (sugar kinase/HSP70/actin superfamily)